MFPYTALADEKEWHVGPYEGVELKILHKDEATGGVTVLRKFHAGTKFSKNSGSACGLVLAQHFQLHALVRADMPFFFICQRCVWKHA